VCEGGGRGLGLKAHSAEWWCFLAVAAVCVWLCLVVITPQHCVTCCTLCVCTPPPTHTQTAATTHHSGLISAHMQLGVSVKDLEARRQLLPETAAQVRGTAAIECCWGCVMGLCYGAVTASTSVYVLLLCA
jgi:hypothetical protein